MPFRDDQKIHPQEKGQSEMSEIGFEMKKLTQHLTVNVQLRGIKVWRLRLWAGMALIRVGLFVCPFNAAYEIIDEKEPKA